MDPSTSALIDLVEAAYDLAVDDEEWLPKLMKAGLPLFDQGLGVGALSYARPHDGTKVIIHQQYVASGPEDFPERNLRFTSAGSAEVSQVMTRPGMAMTLTECAGDRYVEDVERWRRCFDYSVDAFGITAVDPNGEGIHIIAPLAEVTTLARPTRLRWQMIGAHLAAGYRLRVAARNATREATELPHGAEAVIEGRSFRMTDAEGSGRSASSARTLRDAAVRVDRARGRLRETDPIEALKVWRGLSQGRWSLVDWFDSDDRRYVLAIPNPPQVRDPRALTERERQAATYASFGDSNKLIAYRLGLSESTVSHAVRQAMYKLGAKNRAQLVLRMRGDTFLDANPSSGPTVSGGEQKHIEAKRLRDDAP